MNKLFMICFSVLLFAGIMKTEAAGNKLMTIGAEVGVQVPTGNFGDIGGTGYGINANYSYYFQSNFSVNFSLGYYKWGTKTDFQGVDITFSDVPFLGGIQYIFKGSDFHPYIGLEIGFHFTSTNYDYVVTGFGLNKSDSDTRFGFSPIVGIIFPASKEMDIRANLKYNVIDNGNHFGINAGIIYYLK
jgi:opacity protein-like surface antigen